MLKERDLTNKKVWIFVKFQQKNVWVLPHFRVVCIFQNDFKKVHGSLRLDLDQIQVWQLKNRKWDLGMIAPTNGRQPFIGIAQRRCRNGLLSFWIDLRN